MLGGGGRAVRDCVGGGAWEGEPPHTCPWRGPPKLHVPLPIRSACAFRPSLRGPAGATEHIPAPDRQEPRHRHVPEKNKEENVHVRDAFHRDEGRFGTSRKNGRPKLKSFQRGASLHRFARNLV